MYKQNKEFKAFDSLGVLAGTVIAATKAEAHNKALLKHGKRTTDGDLIVSSVSVQGPNDEPSLKSLGFK